MTGDVKCYQFGKAEYKRLKDVMTKCKETRTYFESAFTEGVKGKYILNGLVKIRDHLDTGTKVMLNGISIIDGAVRNEMIGSVDDEGKRFVFLWRRVC